MASEILDFPLPFGPTMTVAPPSKVSLVLSGKDLKPCSSKDFRYTAFLPSSIQSKNVSILYYTSFFEFFQGLLERKEEERYFFSFFFSALLFPVIGFVRKSDILCVKFGLFSLFSLLLVILQGAEGILAEE